MTQDERILYNARAMRKNLTPAELKLWLKIKSKQLGGFRFRRQQPFDKFILDFFCPESKIIIELDGTSHVEKEVYDAQREEYLIRRGYKVLRFTNDEVMNNLDGVLAKILDECQKRVKL
jgi:very-short-patch-repair endonuclease